MEFSKFLLLINYIIFAALAVCACVFDVLAEVAIAWVGVLTIGTGFYFWKSKAENKMKIPMYMLIKLPKEFRDDVDMTEVIKSILGE